jgi:nucleotide-binding universal stress UspA family protein
MTMTGSPKRIVVGIDDSLGSDSAQRWAIDEAQARRLPLHFVHAYAWPGLVSAWPGYSAAAGIDMTAARLNAEHILDTALAQASVIGTDDLELTGEVIEGLAPDSLLAQAQTAAMVVLGSRQLHTVGSFVMGSVSAAVAAHATSPVVITRGPASYPLAGAKVVVGVDGSETSEAAVAFAFDEAGARRVPLHAVCCWHQHLGTADWVMEPRLHSGQTRAEAWLSEALAGWREKYPDVEVTAEAIEDHAVPGLIRVARRAQLIVVGKHGRSPLPATLLGSVSQGLLHHAVCPVAAIPADYAAG